MSFVGTTIGRSVKRDPGNRSVQMRFSTLPAMLLLSCCRCWCHG